MRRHVGLAAAALLTAACSVGDGVPGVTATSTAAPTTTTTTTEPPPALCLETSYRPALGPESAATTRLTAGDPIAAALGFSTDTFECATDVVVASTADLDRVALAARLAAALGGPLLFGRATVAPSLEAELARLLPQRLWVVGTDVVPGEAPAGTETRRLSGDPARLAVQVGQRIGTGPALALPGEGGPATVAAAARAIAEGAVLEPPPPTTTTTSAGTATTSTAASTPGATTSTTTAPGGDAEEAAPLPVVVVGGGERGVVWLVDAGAPAVALAAVAAASSSGGLMAMVDGADLRRIPEVGRALRSTPGGAYAVRLVGEVTADSSWQLPLLLEGEELPGGGYLMFPGRRLVGLYGHAWAPELGALGEQSPREAVERVRPIAAEYAEEGTVTVPAFEIIATVADARAGEDGNYSNETSLEDLRPWIEAAGDSGVYVLLDLQPGRTDFLTQALLYEEFLRLPYVGLALDPEWRLGPGEFHLQQYGSVRAAEINEVSAWLAGVVRAERLPQKMLLLHQFRLSMLPDREQVALPPELAVVIQMDGQGDLDDKYETWAAVTSGTEGAGWFWGWKNFYDEDAPMATPSQVLELEPPVVYVSYQ
jgi:hypothetical protein